jgi:hypothetical protein
MKILAERCSASRFPIEMIIMDEIHMLKMRCTRTEIANRLKAARVLVCHCREIAEGKMFVQGMSATPVINTLHEATSLIELITTTGTSGLPEFSEGQSYRVENCLAVHRKLMEVGLRHTAQHYANPQFIFVDGTGHIKQVPSCERDGLRLELALTKARLPAIIGIVKKNKASGKATLLYTHFIGAALDGSSQSIRDILHAGLSKEIPGLKFEYFTGEESKAKRIQILHEFEMNRIDLLIATAAIATGTDGLQHNCYNLVVNGLPQTASAWEQLVGRLCRTGQTREVVITVISVRSAELYPCNGDCNGNPAMSSFHQSSIRLRSK